MDEKQRRIEMEVALEATPEHVWEAIATGPGISAWFIPTDVEQRPGGRIRQDFGSGFTVEGQLTAWEPGRRIAYGGAADTEPAEQPQGPDYAFEFLIEGQRGATTVLRFVQSGFLDTEGWENEYDSFEHGWRLFFGNLATYLRDFAGRPVRNVVTMGFTPLDPPAAWAALHRALGLRQHPAVGEAVRLTPAGMAAIDGVVDVATPEFLGVRTQDALYRFGAEGSNGCGVSAYHYFYGADVDRDAEQAAWQRWLETLFPAPQPAETGAR